MSPAPRNSDSTPTRMSDSTPTRISDATPGRTSEFMSMDPSTR